MYGVFSWKAYALALTSAVPFMIIYCISNVIFLLLLAKPISEKLDRIKNKYGILQ
ncbi:ECF transporter S component OS=Lysinibacillus sphaericus OX=1421 GN=LS41612_12305 PE=4 SV=1 [Lysinibacillus sphaericus]